MSDFDNWTRQALEKELETVSACRDACLQGDWGPNRRHLAEGYARRADSLALALHKRKASPTDGTERSTTKGQDPQ